MWKVTGCTIMVDGSVDAESRTIVNLLVNSPKGTIFLKSIDATDMLEWPDRLFWIIDKIVIHENKGALVRMFTSEEWKSSEFAEPRSRKWAEDMILDNEFWKYVMICYKGVKPLLNLLLMVDSTMVPIMGFIYEAMERAKDKIRRSLSKSAIERESFVLLKDIIDERWDKQFRSPLHAAGYFLNAQYHYSLGFRDDVKVKRDLQHCITRMVTDHEEISKIEIQLDDFDRQANQFGHPIAVITADMVIPPIWWASLVDGPPELQKFAICVLSLTGSSYGSPRLQEAFEMVHAKNLRYRIDHDVLFVMANSKLAEKKRTSAELNIDDNGDVEGLNVDVSDLDTPCLKCLADAGIADLHDVNGDEDEDGDEDGYEDEN